MAANPNQFATSRGIHEPALRIPRWIQVTLLLTCLVAGPFAAAWVGFRSWQSKVDENARFLESDARSKADAERKKYLSDFIDGLNSAITDQPAGLRVSSKANSRGSEMAGTFRHLRKAHGEIEQRQALAEYLTTPEARKEADRLRIPADILPLAATQLRSQDNRW